MTGNDPSRLSQERLRQIAKAIADGRRDEAKALYREATGKGTIEAVEFVDQLATKLKAKYPERFADTTTNRTATGPAVVESRPPHPAPQPQPKRWRTVARVFARLFAYWWDQTTVKQKMVTVAVVALVWVVVFASRRDDSHSSSPPSRADTVIDTTSTPTPSSPSIGAGSVAVLRTPKGDYVPVASTEANADRLTELAVANDSAGMQQMMLSGQAWGVASGTKCLVINRGFLKSEVRISDGLEASRSGWVASDFLQSAPIAIDLPAVVITEPVSVAPLRCNQFDVTTNYVSEIAESATKRRLIVSVKTDLPDATNIMVGVERSYWNDIDHEEYVANYYDAKSTVGEWRQERVIELDQATWQKEVDGQADRLRRLGEQLIIAKIDDAVLVSIVVPINQSDTRFGPRNANLVGTAVEASGDLKIIRREARLPWPIGKP